MITEFSKYVDKLPASGIRKFFDLVAQSDGDMISLGVGEPDFATPYSIRDEAIHTLEKGLTSYTSNRGLPELRKAISKYLKTRFQCTYNAETEILITHGVSQGVDLVFRSILNPGDEVIIPEPAYVCYEPLIQMTGAKPIKLDTSKTNFIPDPKVLEKKITKKN